MVATSLGGGCYLPRVGSTADLAADTSLRACSIGLGAVADAALNLVYANEVWDSLGVLGGIWNGAVGADALPGQIIGIAGVGISTAGVLVEAKKSARGDLIAAPRLLCQKIDVFGVGSVISLSRDTAEDCGQCDRDGSSELHLDMFYIM